MVVEIEQFVQQIASVAAQYSYGSPVDVRDRANRVWQFKNSRLSVELEFDNREQMMFVLLVRMIAGGLPQGYYRDAAGTKCRIHLNDALEKLRLPINRLYGRLRLDDQCRYLASGLDSALRHLHDREIEGLFD